MKLQSQPITMTTAHTAYDAVDRAVSQGDATIDLADIQQVDSSVVALLLHAQRILKVRNQSLRVVNAPAALSRLLAVYGLETLFEGVLV